MEDTIQSVSPRGGEVKYTSWGQPILVPEARTLRELFRQVRKYTYDSEGRPTHGLHAVPVSPGASISLGNYMVGHGKKDLPDYFSLAVAPARWLAAKIALHVIQLDDTMFWDFIELEDGTVRIFVKYNRILGSKMLMEIPPEESGPIVEEVRQVLKLEHDDL